MELLYHAKCLGAAETPITDGSITVPEALRPYMGGLETLTP